MSNNHLAKADARISDYLANADAWTILDLVAAEFKSDPMSTQCFDLRIVKRAIELAGRPITPEKVFEKHLADESNAAHRALDALCVTKTNNGITLGLAARIRLLARRIPWEISATPAPTAADVRASLESGIEQLAALGFDVDTLRAALEHTGQPDGEA